MVFKEIITDESTLRMCSVHITLNSILPTFSDNFCIDFLATKNDKVITVLR